MPIPLLALSDTHLGEPTSLLDFSEGRERLADALRKLVASQTSDGTVEEVVLIGDIPDRTLASSDKIQQTVRAFVDMLRATVRPKRLVYLPGNHDHTLYSRMVDTTNNLAHPTTYTTPAGGWQLLCAGSSPQTPQPHPIPVNADGYKHFVELFVDLQEQSPFDFIVANPVYVKTFPGLDRSVVFTHGTHFRPDVAAPRWAQEVLTNWKFLEQLLQHSLEPVSGTLTEQPTLSSLEKAVTPFVDTLWPSAVDNDKTRADLLWYVLSTVSGKFRQKRTLAGQDDAICYRHRGHERISVLKENRRSLKRFKEVFLPQLRAFLKEAQVPHESMIFVYGDTHEGGWASMLSGKILAYNTGAWVVHGKQHHPPCHIFVVPAEGPEFLYDVSFQNVRHSQSGESLLAHAAKDVEHRKHTVEKSLQHSIRATLAKIAERAEQEA